MRPARRRAGRLAAIGVAGALALAGCGGGDDGGGAEAPRGSTAGTATAPAKPTLEASQEVVDLVNGYAAQLTDASGGDLGPDELQQRAEELREGSESVAARVEEVVAHPCVERLAIGQASLMEKVADFLQAAAEGDAAEAATVSQELRRTNAAGMVRRAQACQAKVGYRGPQGS